MRLKVFFITLWEGVGLGGCQGKGTYNNGKSMIIAINPLVSSATSRYRLKLDRFKAVIYNRLQLSFYTSHLRNKKQATDQYSIPGLGSVTLGHATLSERRPNVGKEFINTLEIIS